MSYGKEQWFIITAASLFLVGAVFMLINTFGGLEWALWVGLGFAVAAMIVYIIVMFEQSKFGRKFSASQAEKAAVENKEVNTQKTDTINTSAKKPNKNKQ